MNTNEIKKLYTALRGKGYSTYDLGDETAFETKMSDKNNRKELYDWVSSRGDFRMGDYEKYEERLTSPMQPEGTTTDPIRGISMAPVEQIEQTESVVQPQQEEDEYQPLSFGQKMLLKGMSRNAKNLGVRNNPAQAVIDADKEMRELEGNRQQFMDETQLQEVRQANRQQVRDLQADIQSKLQQTQPQDFIWGGVDQTPQMMVRATRMEMDPNTAKHRTLIAANSALDNAQKIINEADRHGADGTYGSWLETSFAGNAARGLGDKLFDVSTWDMGLTDMKDATILKEALDSYDAGRPLTEEQQALLDAKAVELATQAYFGSYLGRGYKAGQVTAEAIPFMIEMAINPASAMGKSAGNMMARYALKRFGKGAATKALSRGARVAGDIAGASTMAATTGIGRVASDATERMAGQVQFATDENSQSVFAGHTEGEDPATAVAKAFGSTTIENYSEMFGNYFSPILGGAGKMFRKGADKIGAGKVVKMLDDVAASDLARIVSDFEKNAQWSGTISEYAEEVAGGIMNAIFVGDQTLDTAEGTGVFNLDQNIDTFLGVALLGGAMSTVKTVGYPIEKYQANKRVSKADKAGLSAFQNSEAWNAVKEKISVDDIEQRAEALTDIMLDNNMSEEQKVSAFKYVEALQNRDGVRMGVMKHNQDPTVTREQVEVEQSYDNGYTLETSQEMNDAKVQLDAQAENLRSTWGSDADQDIDEILGEDPYALIRKVDDEQRGAIIDYLNAKATYDGMIQRVRDDIESQVEANNTLIDQRKNITTGMVVPATLKQDDKAVFVKSGNVVLNDDGSVNNQESSDSIVVMDEAGHTEMIAPSAILTLGQTEEAETLKATQSQQIAEQYATMKGDQIDGVLPFVQGDTYNIMDEQGAQHSVQVVADNGDGSVQVAMDGATEAVTMPKEQIQAMSQAFNKARAVAYNEQNKAQEVAQQEPQAEQKAAEGQPAVVESAQKPVIPTLKDGTPDYNAMDADMFTEQYVSQFGEELTEKIARNNIKEADKAIASIQKQIDGITDPNKLPALYAKQQESEAKKDKYTTVIVNLGLSEDASEDNASRVQRMKKEATPRIAQLFPDGLPNVESVVMADIATGNKIRWTNKEVNGTIVSKGLGAELGLADSKAERTRRISMIGKDAPTPEEYAESLRERLDAMGVRYDESELRNQILNVYASVDTPKNAWEWLENMSANMQADQEGLDYEEEQMRRAYERVRAEQPQDVDFEQHEPEIPSQEEYNQIAQEFDQTEETAHVVEGTQGERTDKQGNRVNQDGSLIVDVVNSIEEITDEDFENPKRSIQLPQLPENVNNAIGADGKPVVIKKNIFERNAISHSDLTPDQSRQILKSALYSTKVYGQNQKKRKPYNWVVISVRDEATPNKLVLLEVNEGKENVEIIHWHYIDQRGLEKLKRQAEREDGQLLILPSENSEEVGALADPTLKLPSDSKDTTSEPKNQEVAEKILQAEAETNIEPSEAQKEAGNYKKGHVSIDGLNITIENPKDTERSGVDENGQKWSVKMNNTYGYIRRTEGKDGDHIDLFLSDHIDDWNGKVFVVDQVKPDGSFDEHKVMYGFDTIEEAEQAYMSNYSIGWKGLGAITGTSKGEFKKWLDSSHRKTKPFAEYKAVKKAEGQSVSAERHNLADFKEGDVVRDYYDKKLYRIKKHSKNGVSTIAMLDEEGNEVYTTQMNAHSNSRYSLANAFVKIEIPTISQESEQTAEQPNVQQEIQHLEEIKNYPGADKKAVQKEIDRLKASTTEEPQAIASEAFSIEPAQYTNKRGKILDMHLVKFADTLTKEQQRAAKELAKAEKGWYDREQGGFMMRSEESAKRLADTILKNDDAVSDAQPVSLTDMQSVSNGEVVFTEPQQPKQATEGKNAPVWQYSISVDSDGFTTLRREDISGAVPVVDAFFTKHADEPQEMLDILRNPLNGMQEVLDAVGTTLENQIATRELNRKIEAERRRKYEELRQNGVNGFKIGDKVLYTPEGRSRKPIEATIHDFEEFGTNNPVLDVGLAPIMYETTEWKNISKDGRQISPNQGNVVRDSNPSGNKLVSDERYAELRERMRKKLGGQMNIGIDPEILAIGTEMAVYHLEKGARKFTEYAKAMIADLGDAIRPYLKAFYNGARNLPEVEDSEIATDMTPYNEVQLFDVANFDKANIDATATAETVVRETEVQQEVDIAQERIKKTRAPRSKKEKKSVTSQEPSLFGEPQNESENGTDENSAANNRGTELGSEELPEAQSVGARTPVQDTAGDRQSKRMRLGDSSRESRSGSQYDVNKNYSNEEISEIVSSITDIVDGKVVITGAVTDDIKAVCRQYKSGGIAKKGRGILDEYYTDGKIVDAVSMLIAPYFKNTSAIRVLEPSVGVGNFIEATRNMRTSDVVAFEINDTTARIAKVLYPNVDVNLRSFETEFIDDSGNKKPLPKKFNLVIGNPPYGSHRGLYKGLGEESKIARYEDYFVKRSLDVLEDGGVLAMVLPSSWIDRHTKYGGYTIEAAYRLPSGAFEATQVGTDIVVLKKDSSVPTSEHTSYFEQHPDRILGEVKQRKGRYGRLEEYVEGNIDAALEAIERDHAKQLAARLDVDETSDNLNDIQTAIEETGSVDNAEAIVKNAQEEATTTKDEQTPIEEEAQSKYKVNLNRSAETAPTSAQFTHEFSEGEIEAFEDTNYDGTINDPTTHAKYANFVGERYVHDFYYAEGDIYTKLAQLEDDRDIIIRRYGVEQYEKQKRLLESVLPKRKGLDEITISPNTAFVKNLTITTESGRESLKNLFEAFCRKLPYRAFGDSTQWEVIGYINNEQVYGQDKQRNQLIRERRKRVANELFVKFLNEELSDDGKRQVVAAFNREYNSVYRPDYSKVPMFSTINRDFKGKPLKLTSVQLAGIGRMTVKGVGVLAHEVGFGKTLSGILAMHEAMTRGFATKPLIVVPNDNILKQWVETMKEVLPKATVNVLGNLGANYDLTGFKVNDGEFTIVTYEGLKAMSFSDGTYNHLAAKFSYITEDLNKHQSERDYQKEIEKRNELKGKMKKGVKTSYGFEDFGFDWLTVDEVHNANHIVSKVRLDKSIASDFRSQSQRTSDLGLKTWLAAQYIQEENNGRNVLLLSATPFTNKPLEYYSILSLVANDMLRRKGFFNVDQFFATFMEADNELEIAANGRPVQKTNVRRFRNNGLFQQLLSEFIDIKGEEDNPDLVRPTRQNKEYKIAQNELTAEAMAEVQDLLSDNEKVLQGIGHARAAAFSPYATSLIGRRPKSHKEFVKNSPKIDATIKLIEQNKKDRPDAGQIIYSEVGVEFFPMIRDYLVRESGFKSNEVRIITGATSNNERVNIQTAFNKGEVKVVIGSPAIKEGLNLQENTTDMYILSLPWNFTQLRQIEGRGWRQGNKWENIRINYMLTNDSVDVFMLQRLQLKQGLYNEAMKSGAESLDVSDIDTAELKTQLITDPAVRAEIVTVQEREKLQQEKTQIEADLSFVTRKFEGYNKLVDALNSRNRELELFRGYAKNETAGYWKQRVEEQEKRVRTVENDIEREKENLRKKGVNIDDIDRQVRQSQAAIEAIQKRIEGLDDFQQELTEKYIREDRAKAAEQGNNLSAYIKERKKENQSGFYKIRSKDEDVRFRVADTSFAHTYDEAFAELEREYQALDKTNEVEVNEWRKKKRNTIQSYLEHMTANLGFPCEVYVFNPYDETTLREAHKKYIDARDQYAIKYNDGIHVLNRFETSYEAFVKDLNDGSEGGYYPESNIAFFNISPKEHGDNTNHQNGWRVILTHENTHRVIEKLGIKKWSLQNLWAVARVHFPKTYSRINEDYKNETPATKGEEFLAYLIETRAYPKYSEEFFNFLLGNNSISEVMDTYKNSVPLVREYIEKVLNEFNNGEAETTREQRGTDDSRRGQEKRTQVRQRSGSVRQSDGVDGGRGDSRRDLTALRESANELASQLNTPIRIVEDVNTITDNNTKLQERKRNAKGWFDNKANEVVVVLPNATSVEDVRETIFHEVVGHKGLRELVGKERFNAFLDKVYANAGEEVRRRIAQRAAKLGWDFHKATEEYIAELAEQGFEERENRNFFEVVRDLFLDMLRRAKIALGYNISDNDLRYMLWRTYQMQRSKGAIAVAEDIVMQQKLGVGNFAPNDTQFRVAENGSLTKRVSDIMEEYDDSEEIFTIEDVADRIEELINEYDGNDSTTTLENILNDYRDAQSEANRYGHRWDAGGEEEFEEALRLYATSDKSSGENILFRAKPIEVSSEGIATGVRAEYEKLTKAASYQSREALQDAMLSLRRYQEMATKAHGKTEDDIKDWENAYMAENQLSSRNDAEIRAFDRTQRKELEGAVSTLKKKGFTYEEINDYMMLKHGIERNREQAVRRAISDKEGKVDAEKLAKWKEAKQRVSNDSSLDSWEKEQRALDKIAQEEFKADLYERDYSGLTAMHPDAKGKVEDAVEMSYDEVNAFEQKGELVNTNALWNAVRASTMYAMNKMRRSSLISKETMDDIVNMYSYYVPLRGFDETTSDEVYGYMNNEPKAFNAPIRKAKGRATKADAVLPYIVSAAHSAIMQGNRNVFKLRFLNFVEHYPTDLVTKEKMWVEFDKSKDEWVAKFPDLKETDSAEDVARKREEFEAKMKKLSEEHPESVKEVKQSIKVPYRVLPQFLQQHQIIVKRNGVDVVLTVNGSPRLAMAINGIAGKQAIGDKIIGGAVGRGAEKATRYLSGIYTQYSPDFMISNFFRDAIYTNTMVWLKESPQYALKFHQNMAICNPFVMMKLFHKLENGTLDMSNELEREFNDFIMNGGETGYAKLASIEELKKDIERTLDPSMLDNALELAKKLSAVNRAVENVARFAAYRTSRQSGRSISRSVNDAKEISVNFNRKGAGDFFYGAKDQTTLGKAVAAGAGIARPFYAFFNASMQGLANVSKIAKRKPIATGTLGAGLFILGALLASMAGDDEEEYYNLPEYVRRQNITFKLSDGTWASIPLPIEYRAIYGLGEMIVSVVRGKEDFSDHGLAYKVAEQLAQVLPINVLEGKGGLGTLAPTLAAPVVEVLANEDWAGIPIYREDNPFTNQHTIPEYQRVYSNTGKGYVAMSKFFNDITGGDEVKKGWADKFEVFGVPIGNNPAIAEHLVDGYLGGPAQFLNKVASSAEMVAGAKEFDWRSVPFANRLVKTSNPNTRNKAINNLYFNNVEEAEDLASVEKGYSKIVNNEEETPEKRAEYAKKLDKLHESEEWKKAKQFLELRKEVDNMRKVEGVPEEYISNLKAEANEIYK